MNINLEKVRYSKVDREKNIKIPAVLTTELAEDIGIHIGDGSLYWSNQRKTSTEFDCSFHAEEKSYREYVLNLKKRLYNIPRFRTYQYGNELRLRFCSLAVATFYHEVLKFPIGKKSDIVGIPKLILNAKDHDILASCLRGIVDTDFYVRIKPNGYRQMYGYFSSKNLIEDLSILLKKLKIGHTTVFNAKKFDKRSNRNYKMHHIYISGHKRFNEYVAKAGFSNEKNIKKINGPEAI